MMMTSSVNSTEKNGSKMFYFSGIFRRCFVILAFLYLLPECSQGFTKLPTFRLKSVSIARANILYSSSEETEIGIGISAEDDKKVTVGNVSATASRFAISSKKLLLEAQKLRLEAEELEVINAFQKGNKSSKVSIENEVEKSNPIPKPSVLTPLSGGGVQETILKTLQKLSGDDNLVKVFDDEKPPKYSPINVTMSERSRMILPPKLLSLPNKDTYVMSFIAESRKIPTLDEVINRMPVPFFLHWFIKWAISAYITESKGDDGPLYDIAFAMELSNLLDAIQLLMDDEAAVNVMDPFTDDGSLGAMSFEDLFGNTSLLLGRADRRFTLLKLIRDKQSIQPMLESWGNVMCPSTAEINDGLEVVIVGFEDIVKIVEMSEKAETDEEKLKLLQKLKAINDEISEKFKELTARREVADLDLEMLQTLEKELAVLEMKLGMQDIAMRRLEASEKKSNEDKAGKVEKSQEQKEMDMSNMLSTFVDTVLTEADVDCTAMLSIQSYFDVDSRKDGLNKAGAGRFQSEVLRGLFSVTAVKVADGSALFDGSIVGGTTEEFFVKVEERLRESGLDKEVDFVIIKNDRIPKMSSSLEQMALDSLLGSSTAVVAFPRSWKPLGEIYAEQRFRKAVRALLFGSSLLTCAVFSANSFGLLSSTGPPIGDQPIVLPDDMIWLSITPVMIQLAAQVAEVAVGRPRGIRGVAVNVPSLRLPLLGSRVIYASLPRTRNDMFDTAFAGAATALLTSLAAMLIGFQLSVDAPSVDALPAIPLAVLHVNTIVAQFAEFTFPGIFSKFATAPSTPVHLHWLAIAGVVSFIGSTLQLFPFDNSAGSKLAVATVGKENFFVVSLIGNVVRFIVLSKLLFSTGFDPSETITSSLLLCDYVVSSALASDPTDNTLVKDNLTGTSEGRKILYFLAQFFLVFGLVSFSDISADVSAIAQSLGSFFSSLTSGGGTSQIFPSP